MIKVDPLTHSSVTMAAVFAVRVPALVIYSNFKFASEAQLWLVAAQVRISDVFRLTQRFSSQSMTSWLRLCYVERS